jgi:outer membrane protein
MKAEYPRLSVMNFRAALLTTCILTAMFPVALAAQGIGVNLKVERARLAIAQGNYDVAEKILLSTVNDDTADRNDLDFLRGSIALAKGDYDAAITHFRSILTRDPSLTRVRLDLARAFFAKGDDDNARHHFQIAQGGDLPPEVRAKVEEFLAQIQRRKRWSVNFSFALAPDTNMNGATQARGVTLYGLPFQLDDNARKQSGVGINTSLGGVYEFDVAEDTKFKVGAQSYVTEYESSDFDDYILTAYAGPRFLVGRSEVSVLASGLRRWYGGEGYKTSYGARIEVDTPLSPRAILSASADVQKVEYDEAKDYDGWQGSLNGVLTYGITQNSFMRFIGGVRNEWTQVDALDNTEWTAGVGFFQEFPYGFGLYAQPKVSFTRYDAQLAAFGETRNDRTIEFRASVSNRKVEVLGFTPVLTFVHSRRDSNIDLYDYKRNRVEIGVTRTF